MIEMGTAKERIEERKRRRSITSIGRPIQELEKISIASGGMLESERWREGSLVAGGMVEGGLPGGQQQHA
jgi:hypothetical protein